jgi:hypothetical protein
MKSEADFNKMKDLFGVDINYKDSYKNRRWRQGKTKLSTQTPKNIDNIVNEYPKNINQVPKDRIAKNSAFINEVEEIGGLFPEDYSKYPLEKADILVNNFNRFKPDGKQPLEDEEGNLLCEPLAIGYIFQRVLNSAYKITGKN